MTALHSLQRKKMIDDSLSTLHELEWIHSTTLAEPTVAYSSHNGQDDEPLIRFLNQMLESAITESASDIHIEPYETICRIRYRCHSILISRYEIPLSIAKRLTIRLKVLAKLDVTERRVSQDGRFQWQHIDIRMNTCPIQYGEKIVLRLMNLKKQSLDIHSLGLTIPQKELLLNVLSSHQGLILVTGPTGSGKSFTLYSALNYLNTQDKNISTIEDPIEIQLEGINQININPKIEFDFSAALKALLRQDPDIIMIGEIRDKETAETAIQAADTGHLVLATLHTKDSIDAINRLCSMGIPTHRLLSVLSLVISQRLIRLLCEKCKKPFLHHGLTVFEAFHCEHCSAGYENRTGIYELFHINHPIYTLLMNQANKQTIQTEAMKFGYQTLYQSGLEKWKQGLTSLTEIERLPKP